MARRRSSRPLARRHVANPALQTLHIARRFPTFTFVREGGEAVWRGTFQPRQSSPLYRVAVRKRPGRAPRVNVMWPQLDPLAPHVYSDGRLCLYWPEEWVWRESELIAETILPWTALWLYYYELWLDSGVWLGPSSHDAALSKTGGERSAA